MHLPFYKKMVLTPISRSTAVYTDQFLSCFAAETTAAA
jgi:hypothetical protein